MNMLLLLSILFPFLLQQTSPQGPFTLKVTVTGASPKGNLMAEIRNENGQVVHQIKQPVKALGTTLTFANLPKGRYAVAVFHDEDANGTLNTTFLGLPTESYGFSNNARGIFGPPSLQQQLVEVKADAAISIEVK